MPPPYRSAETEDPALNQVNSDFACIKFFRRTKLSSSSRLRVTFDKSEKLRVDSTLGGYLGQSDGLWRNVGAGVKKLPLT